MCRGMVAFVNTEVCTDVTMYTGRSLMGDNVSHTHFTEFFFRQYFNCQNEAFSVLD